MTTIIYTFLALFLFGITVWTFRILKAAYQTLNYKKLGVVGAYIIIIGSIIHGLEYLI